MRTLGDVSGLGLHSHRELDRSIFAYPEKRKRAEGKRLAYPGRIDAFGQSVVLYPDFGLAGMIVERPSDGERELLALVDREAQALYGTSVFMAFTRRVTERLRKDWVLDRLVEHVAKVDMNILIELHGEIADAETRLRDAGVVIERAVGCLKEITGPSFVIQDDHEAEFRTTPINAAISKVLPGAWVVRDRFVLGSRSGDLVVSTVDPRLLPHGLRSGQNVDDAGAASPGWDQMFERLDYTPLTVPVLRADAREAEAFDGVVSAPVDAAFAVSFSVTDYAGANSMTRSARTAA